MSVISDFSERVSAQFSIINTATAGLTVDVQWLKTKIEQLQNSSGEISAADQALLDSIENRINVHAANVALLDSATTVTPTPDEPTQPE